MSQTSALVLVLLCASSALALPQHRREEVMDDAEIIDAVAKSCPWSSMMCPHRAFAKEPILHLWDKAAVLASPAIRFYNSGYVPKEQEKTFFREVFCCSQGDCLADCSLKLKNETDLVKAFPSNAQDLLDLQLPELEPYEAHVRKYLATHGNKHRATELSAEIEELFDHITEHNDRFTNLLNAQKARKQQQFGGNDE